MSTKAYNRFVQRISYFEADLQLSEGLLLVFKKLENSNRNLAETLGLDISEYPRLNQKNTKASRDIRSGHLIFTLRSSFIKEIYEDFLEYISDCLAKAALAGVDPGRFVGEAKVSLEARDILSAGNWDNVVRMVSKEIFRDLERQRKTTSLIEKSIKKLGLSVPAKVRQDALPFFELRHLLVHEDGRRNEEFVKRFPKFKYSPKKRVVLDKALIDEASRTVCALAAKIDEQILAKNLVRARDIGP